MNQIDSGIINDDDVRHSVKLEYPNIRVDSGICLIDNIEHPENNKMTSISYNVEYE
jgi:hypothetical protein